MYKITIKSLMRIKTYDLLSMKQFDLLWSTLYSSFLFMFLSFPIKVSLKNYIFQKCALQRREWKILRKVYFVWKIYILFSCSFNICLLDNRLCKTVICIWDNTFITSTKKCRFWPPNSYLQQRSHSSNLCPQ